MAETLISSRLSNYQISLVVYNYPSWVSKVYEPADIDKTLLVDGSYSNLDRFTRYGLGTLTFGAEFQKESEEKNVFWFEENVIIRDYSFIEIPKFLWSTEKFYCYLYLEYQCDWEIAFVKGVSSVNA